MHTFEELREKYKVFEYTGYETEWLSGDEAQLPSLQVRYHYEIPGLSTFSTRWIFPAERCTDSAILDELLFSLGMAEAISYYKCACPERVTVRCGRLSHAQISWWEKLFYKGLGEFQYRNGIDVSQDELLHIECDAAGGEAGAKDDLPLHDSASYEGVMVPIGGGKDSVVSLELLKGREVYTYSVNESDTIRNVIACCDHVKGNLPAKRILDKKIIELNGEGYLNGHIPFSAVVAFSTVICAYLNGIRHIALSNESSANESTVKDSFVNHQYSKSYEFEQDFTGYISGLTDSDIHYFSLLRPYAEISIARMFAEHKAYHKAFRSCNAGSKQGIWCCNCPKCLFVYIILSPFLTEDELTGIFGEKLLDKESLDKDFRELMGIDENKPFECVGTRSEVCAAIRRFVARGGRSLLTDRYAAYISGLADDLDDLLSDVSTEHNIPRELSYTIKGQGQA